METFTMSRKEAPRAGLVHAALAGRITNQQGATALRLSVRQFHRLKKRFARDGPRGLLHRSRGRPSPRRLDEDLRQRITALITTAYPGLNDVHLAAPCPALPPHRGSPRLRRRLRPGLPPVRPAARGLWRPPQHPRAQRRPLVARRRAARRPAPHPPRAPPAGARRRLYPGPLPAGQGARRASVANPAGPPRQRAAPPRDRHPRGGQCLPAHLPRRLQPPLRPAPGRPDRRLAAAAPRARSSPQLSLSTRRRPPQPRPPRPPLGADSAGPRRPLLRRLPRRGPRTPRWPVARLLPGAVPRRAALARRRLRPAAAQRPECPAPPARAPRRAPRDRSAPPGAAIRPGAAVSLPPEIDHSDNPQRPSVLFHAGARASLAHELLTSPPRPRGRGPERVTFSWNS